MGLTDLIDRGNSVIRNLPYLYEVLSPIDTDAPFSEMNSHNYASKWKFSKVIRSSLFPIYSPFRGVPTLPCENPDRPPIQNDQKWFFLNGICTNRDVLRLNGKALANLFGRTIHLLHNPSDGIILDLLECAVGRTMQPISTLDESVATILKQALETEKKVILIAHSQGGIISARACRILAESLASSHRGALLKKLELYTFASAATSLEIPAIYAEHYYNTLDYVARIGVAGNLSKFSGKKFAYEATGHLLNTHYLPHFEANAYKSPTRERSRLLGYLDSRRN
ncbi:hypothetical protein [Hahella ganghwensis]|uniref:alpha/beta hydrolase n=1 Tax=Hahella ganghwensis TaxID=286420 RepID=UPI000364A806|nr:hypothetical protein [Hahella ganghwensis]